MPKCKRQGAGATSPSVNRLLPQAVCLDRSKDERIRAEVFLEHWYCFLGDEGYSTRLWGGRGLPCCGILGLKDKGAGDYRNSVWPSHVHGLFSLGFILMTFKQRGANCELPLINGLSSPVTFSQHPLASLGCKLHGGSGNNHADVVSSFNSPKASPSPSLFTLRLTWSRAS